MSTGEDDSPPGSAGHPLLRRVYGGHGAAGPEPSSVGDGAAPPPPAPPTGDGSAGGDKRLVDALKGALGRRGYTEIESVGVGAFGVVFRAVHPSHPGTVAVKVITFPANDDIQLRQFRTEIETVAKLSWPNIISIRDGESVVLGRPYFSMEYVASGSLRTFLNSPVSVPRTPNQVARFVRILARAIHVAHTHELKVVHRDLKPENILLDRPSGGGAVPPDIGPVALGSDFAHEWGIPKVTDFGLAKPLEGRSTVLPAGDVVGTFGYIAPEQVTGSQPVGPPADVWALGVLLYELLAGTLPYPPRATPELFRQAGLTNSLPPPPRIRGFNRAAGYDLETVCLRCLELVPSDRYPSAAALAGDLDNYVTRRPIAARRRSRLHRLRKWSQRNRGAAALGVALGVSLSAFAGYGLTDAVQAHAARRLKAAAAARRELVDDGFKMLAALAEEKPSRPERMAEACERLRGVLDPDSHDVRELTLARAVRVRLGVAYFDLGRRGDADRELTHAIGLLRSRAGDSFGERQDAVNLLYFARTTRGRNFAALANQRLPLRPSAKAAQTDEVVRGATDLARAVVDMDQALRDIPPATDPNAPAELGIVSATRPGVAAARAFSLIRLRPYLSLLRVEDAATGLAGRPEAAVAIADLLDQCPTLHAGEAHYDVACAYAGAYARLADKDRLVRVAVRHLRLVHQPGVVVRGLPGPTLHASILSDPDFAAVRTHPDLVAFLHELEAAGPPKR